MIRLVVILVVGLTFWSACTIVNGSQGTNVSISPGDYNKTVQSSNIGTRTYGDTVTQLFLEIESNTDVIINSPDYSTKEKDRAREIREETEVIRKNLSQDSSVISTDKKEQLARLWDETSRIMEK